MDPFLIGVIVFLIFAYAIGSAAKKVNDNPVAKAAGLDLLKRLLK
jgi:hypothetical protein